MSVARVVFCVLLAMAPTWAMSAPGRSSDDAETARGIPYRRGHLVVDGDLSDWDGPALEVRFAEEELAPPLANRVEARVTWDRDFLWLAFRVHDNEVFRPPELVNDFRVWRWDSVEAYIDADGSGGPRMGAADFQLILSAGGRGAVLEGDPILGSVEELTVPKIERPAITVQAAASPTGDGYDVECSVPMASLGITAAEGSVLRLDLACNDWLEDHPLLPEVVWNAENLILLRDGAEEPLKFDSEALSGDEVRAIERRAYRPVAWSGSRDWGFPNEWKVVRLVGRMSFFERLLRRFGVVRLVVLVAVVCLAVAGAIMSFLHLAGRRRVRDVLSRLEVLEQTKSSPARMAETGHEDILRGRTGRFHELVEGSEAESFEERAIVFIYRHLDEEDLTPARLARELHVSLRSLQRKVNEAMGCTPGELITGVRMREALRLLETGRYRVGEVAYRVGFSNPSHFSTRFRKVYGVPPVRFLGRDGR